MKQIKIFWAFVAAMLYLIQPLRAEDGYRLWLRYDQISDRQKLDDYRRQLRGWMVAPSLRGWNNLIKHWSITSVLSFPSHRESDQGISQSLVIRHWSLVILPI